MILVLLTELASTTAQSTGGDSALVTGGAVAIALGLVRTVEALIVKLGRGNGKAEAFNAADRSDLRDLHVWHAPGESGTQEWKNPAIRQILEEIRDHLAAMRRRGRDRDDGDNGLSGP